MSRTITFKAAKHTDAARQAFVVDLSKLPADRYDELAYAGFARMVSVATKDSGEAARLRDIADITAAVNRGDWPKAFNGAGSGGDPVLKEAMLIAELEIARALRSDPAIVGPLESGDLPAMRKAIAQHEKGKKYFTIGKAGYALANATAILSFIDANPSKEIRARAEAAVAARLAAHGEQDDDSADVVL